MKRVYRVSFNVNNERVIRVLEEIPKGKKTQFITNCILEHIQRMEWSRSKGKGTVDKEGYSFNIRNELVIKVLEQIPRGERRQHIINCILEHEKIKKWIEKRKANRAKERAEHKEVKVKVE